MYRLALTGVSPFLRTVVHRLCFIIFGIFKEYFMFSDKYFQEAVILARSAKGSTSPNPAVGTVIVKNGVIVGTGATQSAGQSHAEIMALTQAGIQARDASMYVTLEPCVDYPGKRTPSCTQAIINAGVREIYIAMPDPNPQVRGLGISRLRQAGLEVHVMEEPDPALLELNEDYFKYIQTAMPFVYGKYAMTLDGNIANSSGDSQWVSGPGSLAWVHELRNKVDAILVGIGTVLKDNPTLNVRLVPRIKDPYRIIIDPRGETPPHFTVMADELRTLFVTAEDVDPGFIRLCDKQKKDHISMKAPFSYRDLFSRLAREKQIESILVEGGGRVFHRCFEEEVIDKLIVCVAPKILGGTGIQPFNGPTDRIMDKALKLKHISVENIDGDLLIQGYLNADKYQSKETL